jgi:imidazolonepropionase
MPKTKLIGPFTEIVTLASLPLKGALRDEQLQPIWQGGILVAEGRIVEVGSFDELHPKASEVEGITTPAVALPGLADCHTHLVWGGSRARDYALRMQGATYEDILNAGGGIHDSVAKTRATGFDQLKTDLLARIDHHLRGGVTTIEVKTGYGLDVTNELKELEVMQSAQKERAVSLVTTCLAAHVCPKEFTDKQTYLDYILRELLPESKRRNLAQRVDVFVEPSAFPTDLARTYLTEAKKLGFVLTLHADQFHTGGSALAVELGALSADHLEASREKEITLLAKSDVMAVALPGASLGLGMPFTPARKLLNAGAGVAIATDWNPGSAPMGDLLTQAAILGAFEKLSAAEVLAGITFRAAAALGLHDRGRLTPGQKADFISFPTDDYREILYQQGRMRPSLTWIDGHDINLKPTI